MDINKIDDAEIKHDENIMTYPDMQRVWNYTKVQNTATPIWSFGIVFAALFGVGVASKDFSYLIIAVLLFAAVLSLLPSKHNFLTKATPSAFLINGVCCIVLAVVSFAIVFIKVLILSEKPSIFSFAFVFLLFIGVENIAKSKRLSNLPDEEPEPQEISKIDDIINKLKKTKPADDESVIEFDIYKDINYRKWKGLLEPEGGVFMSSDGDDVIFVDKDQAQILPKKRHQKNRYPQAFFHFADRKLNGKISAENLEVFNGWNPPVSDRI